MKDNLLRHLATVAVCIGLACAAATVPRAGEPTAQTTTSGSAGVLLVKAVLPPWMAMVDEQFTSELFQTLYAQAPPGIELHSDYRLKQDLGPKPYEKYRACTTVVCRRDILLEAGIGVFLKVEIAPAPFNALDITAQVIDDQGTLLFQAKRMHQGSVAGLKTIVASVCIEALKRLAPEIAASQRTVKPQPTGPSSGAALDVFTGSQRLIPRGTVMLSPVGSNQPALATVKEFYLDLTEVRYQEYMDCVQKQKCAEPRYDMCKGFPKDAKLDAQRRAKMFMQAGQPMVCVNREEATMYCEWRQGRLPTELEWLRAARGSDDRAYSWGLASASPNLARYNDRETDPCVAAATAEILSTNAVANNIRSVFPCTVPVDWYQAAAGPYGHLQLTGNVWEWVSDLNESVTKAASPTPADLYPIRDRLGAARGGAWSSSETGLTVYTRLVLQPDERRWDVGFRCARGVSP